MLNINIFLSVGFLTWLLLIEYQHFGQQFLIVYMFKKNTNYGCRQQKMLENYYI